LISGNVEGKHKDKREKREEEPTREKYQWDA
jgi:hypothetical protein